jgi:hypothetical protein
LQVTLLFSKRMVTNDTVSLCKWSFVSNYRPISVLNNIAQGFGFVAHDHTRMSHWFKHNMNSYQNGFIKVKKKKQNPVSYQMNSCQNGFIVVKFSIQNPVSFQDFFVPLVSSQRQVQFSPFYSSTVIDLVQHSVLLQELRILVLQDICVKLFTAL